MKSVLHKVVAFPFGVEDPTIKFAEGNFLENVIPQAIEGRFRGKKIILSVGRLVSYKGFDVLIKSARHIRPDALIVIVGDGPLRQSLESIIAEEGVGDRVVVAGKLEDDQLSQIFRRASVFCLPSVERSEAFGVVQIEAMAYGIPVVATEISGSGVPWVNQHNVSGINVPVKDPIQLAAACNEILSSEKVHESLSKGARDRFLSEFIDQLFVERMVTAYRKLMTTTRS